MSQGDVDDLRRARRILCYGVTGSGKSTAAVQLGAALGLPVHLVDDEIGWLPGWVERDLVGQREIAGELAARPAWVLDSAYGKWADLVLARVDVMVALDYPRHVSLGRLLRRTWRRWRTREEVCNGNVESLGQIVSRDSIILWHFRSFARKRSRIAAAHADPGRFPVIRLAHPRQLDELLAELGEAPVGAGEAGEAGEGLRGGRARSGRGGR